MKSKIISTILILAISISFMGISLGSFDIRESDLPLSDDEFSKMLEENTPSTDVDYFNTAKSTENASIIAVSGELPAKSGVDAYDWGITLQKIAKNVQNSESLKEYLSSSGGPITGYSVSTDGLMKVHIDENTKLTDDEIVYIQSVFEEHATEMGIKSLPLIIVHENLMINSQLAYNEVPKENIRNIRSLISKALNFCGFHF